MAAAFLLWSSNGREQMRAELVRIEREKANAELGYPSLRGPDFLNRRLSKPRLAIFDSRVWWGIPSFAAAPRGPETRPWHSVNAASITFRSRKACLVY